MTSRAIHAVDGMSDPLVEAVEHRVRSAGVCVGREARAGRDVPCAGEVSLGGRVLGRGAP